MSLAMNGWLKLQPYHFDKLYCHWESEIGHIKQEAGTGKLEIDKN